MKNVLLSLCVITILPVHILHAQLLQGRSFFSPRSQSTNLAREMSGWYPHIYKPSMNHNYASVVCTPAHTNSVRPGRIADYLFGTDQLAISGSAIQNRGPEDLLADYFGLSPNFASTVTITPSITNALLNLDGYWGFDRYCRGLYVRIHAPIVHTRWKLHLYEDRELVSPTIPFQPFYMDTQQVLPASTTFLDVLSGKLTFGQMQEPLKFGKVDGARSKTALSDLQLTLGWNFILEPEGHVGISLRCAAPTGTRPENNFLFEPIVGNGHHWEYGAGINAHSLLWEKDGEQHLAFYFEMNLMSLAPSRQRRSFDLTANGFASRYTLVKEFDAQEHYTGKLSPLINHTTLDCKVHTDIQCDILFLFDYTYNGFVFDIGYNGWIKSREKISILECFPANTFALKGIQNVVLSSGDLSIATQSNATIYGNNISEQSILINDPSPAFISPQALDPHSAAAWRMLTHKIFAYLGYTWFHTDDSHRYKPFIGIGGEIEFEGENSRNSAQVDKPTLSQLGFWAKIGFDC